MSLKYCPACDCDKWLYSHSRDAHCRKFAKKFVVRLGS